MSGRRLLDPAERADYETSLAAARTELGEAAVMAAWAAGQALSLDEAVAEALGGHEAIPVTGSWPLCVMPDQDGHRVGYHRQA